MKRIFADANYLIALINKGDENHNRAKVAESRFPPGTELVTTEMILAEFLNFVSNRCRPLKAVATDLVHRLKARTNVRIVSQTSEMFGLAFEVYRAYGDKAWSLTDCASYNVMKKFGISDALAHDRHFEQMGFRAILRQREES